MLCKLSIIGAVVAVVLMIPTTLSAQMGGAINPGVHVGGAVNPGATVRGAVERGRLYQLARRQQGLLRARQAEDDQDQAGRPQARLLPMCSSPPARPRT